MLNPHLDFALFYALAIYRTFSPSGDPFTAPNASLAFSGLSKFTKPKPLNIPLFETGNFRFCTIKTSPTRALKLCQILINPTRNFIGRAQHLPEHEHPFARASDAGCDPAHAVNNSDARQQLHLNYLVPLLEPQQKRAGSHYNSLDP